MYDTYFPPTPKAMHATSEHSVTKFFEPPAAIPNMPC